jgi:hypothetical protein
MSKPKTPPYNFEKDIKGWNEFLAKCEQRVKDDEKELLQTFSKEIKFKLLRNPEICPNPEYLLLCMEPSRPQTEAKGVNFFPLFLHYCAWEYLCNKDFNYYITDLAKGATYSTLQGEIKNYRYKAWLPLFVEEWKLLSRPKIIVVSKGIYGKFQKEDFLYNIEEAEDICEKIIGYILHYSIKNSSIEEEYNYIKKISPVDFYQPNEDAIKPFGAEFRKQLDTERYNYPYDYMNSPLGKTKDDINHNMKVVALYRHDFKQLNETGKIPHIE